MIIFALVWMFRGMMSESFSALMKDRVTPPVPCLVIIGRADNNTCFSVPAVHLSFRSASSELPAAVRDTRNPADTVSRCVGVCVCPVFYHQYMLKGYWREQLHTLQHETHTHTHICSCISIFVKTNERPWRVRTFCVVLNSLRAKTEGFRVKVRIKFRVSVNFGLLSWVKSSVKGASKQQAHTQQQQQHDDMILYLIKQWSDPFRA